MKRSVPRLGRWLLHRVLARDCVDDVVGDLEERFPGIAERRGEAAARRWYVLEVVKLCLRPSLLRLPSFAFSRGLVGDVSRDVRFAFRLMRREPVTSAAIIVTLAVGLGAVTTAFSAIDRFLMRLPDGVAAPERLVEIYRRSLNDMRPRAPGYEGYHVISQSAFRSLGDARTLEATSLTSPGWQLSVHAGGPEAERFEAMFTSANFFDLLGARLLLGRGFEPLRDDAPGGAPIVVLAHALWRNRFAGDSQILGRTLRIEGRDFTVAGVAMPGFAGTSIARAPDMWIPISMIEAIPLWGARAATTGMFIAVARLRDGVQPSEVEAELDRIGREHYGAAEMTFRVAPLRTVTVDPNRRAAFVSMGTALFAGVAIVLLIACINVANILLARSMRRRRELAVCVALGAGRGRLVRQLFTESTLLFVLGGALGIVLLGMVRPWVSRVRPPDRFFFSNPQLDLPVDLRVLAFTLLATGLSATIFGMLPALRAARTDPRVDLHAYAEVPRRRLGTRDLLVVLQIAFCLVALAGAGLFLRGLNAARSIDPGFDPGGVEMVSVNLHYGAFDRDRQHDYYRRAREAALSVEGVVAAGFSWQRPLEFSPVYAMRRAAVVPLEERYTVRATAITPGFLEAVRMPLRAGRDFRSTDRRPTGTRPADTHYVVILNERAAEMLWPGDPPEDAVGRFVYGGFIAGDSAEIVGIVPTGRQITMGEEPTPAVYTSHEQMLSVPTATLFVRTDGRSDAVMQEVVQRVRAIDPDVPIYDVEPATALVERALWGARAGAGLLTAMGAIGLFLAALGIYGVVSGVVGERRREIGIRRALGADRFRVYSAMIGRVLAIVVAGILIGLAAMVAIGRVMAGLLYGVPPTDPITLTSVAASLLLVAFAAAYIPSARATRIEPLDVLRGD